MPERIQLTGPPEQAAAQLWAYICEKTMLDGEKLDKFDSPEAAAQHFLPQRSRAELEKVNDNLIKTLQKVRAEREDIFERNSALADAVGKLIKEKDIFLAAARFCHQRHDGAAKTNSCSHAAVGSAD